MIGRIEAIFFVVVHSQDVGIVARFKQDEILPAVYHDRDHSLRLVECPSVHEVPLAVVHQHERNLVAYTGKVEAAIIEWRLGVASNDIILLLVVEGAQSDILCGSHLKWKSDRTFCVDWKGVGGTGDAQKFEEGDHKTVSYGPYLHSHRT